MKNEQGEGHKARLIQEYFRVLQSFNESNLILSQEEEDELDSIHMKLLEEKEKLSITVKSLGNNSQPSSDNLLSLFITEIRRDTSRVFTLISYLIGSRKTQYKLYGIFLIFLIAFLLLNVFLFNEIFYLTLFSVVVYLLWLWTSNVLSLKLDEQKKLQRSKLDCEVKIQELEETYNRRVNELKNLQTRRKESLRAIEEEVKIHLEEDRFWLIQTALEDLKIRNPYKNEDSNDNSQQWEMLERDPIVSFTGMSSKETNNNTLSTDRDLEEVISYDRKLHIAESDFYSEIGLDGGRKFGVYEFVVVFLSSNFLSYYKCYWNFLKRSAVDIEICEYLYDSIVSIKTSEKSSLTLKNPEEQRFYRATLSITTTDGKIFYLKLSKDRKRRINSSKNRYITDVYGAAECIRYWLRQRRVDYKMIRSIDL